jgi:hypothetical protein
MAPITHHERTALFGNRDKRPQVAVARRALDQQMGVITIEAVRMNGEPELRGCAQKLRAHVIDHERVGEALAALERVERQRVAVRPM